MSSLKETDFQPLPTPYAHVYPLSEEGHHEVCFTPSSQPPADSPQHQPVFTAEQMHEYVAQDRKLREAAQAPLAKVDNSEGEVAVTWLIPTAAIASGFLYASPPAPKRLSPERIEEIFRTNSGYGGDDFHAFARAIEDEYGIGKT